MADGGTISSINRSFPTRNEIIGKIVPLVPLVPPHDHKSETPETGVAVGFAAISEEAEPAAWEEDKRW